MTVRTTMFAGGVLALALAGAFLARPAPAPVARPATVTIPAGTHIWRPFGDYRRDGILVAPPLVAEDAPALVITRDLVARADYALCAADGACPPAVTGPGDYPQTGVNWYAATAYAGWLSKSTGLRWRLPTDAEWQRAAAERASDDQTAASGADPSRRWLSQYDRTAELRGAADPVLRPRGGWGTNSRGLADIAGNVWEWTDSCLVDADARGDGPFVPRQPYCGVRIAEGRHRAPVSDFVGDASSGGCGAGLPPDHLGFRLVLDPP